MTETQQEDIFIEYGLYDESNRKAMIQEYQELQRLENFDDSFLDYLKVKLEIEGYWKKIGLT